MEVLAARRRVVAGGPRQQVVLATLLLTAGRIVTSNKLIEAVWWEPPSSSASNLRVYVAGLRRMFGSAGENPDRLITCPGGYMLRVEPGEFDVSLFEACATQGDEALHAGDFEAAAACLAEALALWRGEPLEGLPVGAWLLAELTRLQERRLAVTIGHVEAQLALGHAQDLIPQLRVLVERYPFQELLWGQLMRALYRLGRRAEALQAYAQARHRLADELGIEPGAELCRMQEQILRAAPIPGELPPTQAVGARPDLGPAGQATVSVTLVGSPQEVPTDIAEFTGRHDELARLHALADQVMMRATTAPEICAIEGTPGVGKTRLAVRAAHELIDKGHFPDAQLWADLHGFDPVRPPTDAARVLERFLRSLGIPGGRIPQDIEERAALYRRLLHHRAALVLLDNAVAEDQVRPLLPGSASCMVVITSRRSLTGLDGATHLELDVLAPSEALTLLGLIVDDGRVAAEPAAATRLIEACAGLPLAIVLAARRLRRRPTWPIARLADRLRQHPHHDLAIGSRSVRNSFDLSYNTLPPTHQHMFRLLGTLPGPDATASLAAALAGTTPAAAECQLEELLDEHLLQQSTADRYRFHDLLRSYAAQHARDDEPPAVREAALRRALNWYLHTAATADRVLYPDRRHLAPTTDPPAHVGTFDGRQDALNWLEAEHLNLVAAVRSAAEHGWHDLAWQLPAALLSYFYLTKPWNDWQATHQIARQAAETLNDLVGQAWAWHGLGIANSDLRRYDQALTCHYTALEFDRATHDLEGQAWNLNSLGVIHVDLDQCADAIPLLKQAVALHCATENTHGEALSLNNLADAHRRLGHLHHADSLLSRALTLQRHTADRHGERYTLGTLGDLHHDQRNHPQAIAHYKQALQLSRQLGDHWHAAHLALRLGHAQHQLGLYDAAVNNWRTALTYLDHIHDPDTETIRRHLKTLDLDP
jgi:DNA-binding SARP family transcriptional activator